MTSAASKADRRTKRVYHPSHPAQQPLPAQPIGQFDSPCSLATSRMLLPVPREGSVSCMMSAVQPGYTAGFKFSSLSGFFRLARRPNSPVGFPCSCVSMQEASDDGMPGRRVAYLCVNVVVRGGGWGRNAGCRMQALYTTDSSSTRIRRTCPAGYIICSQAAEQLILVSHVLGVVRLFPPTSRPEARAWLFHA